MPALRRNPFTPNFGSVPVWMAGRSGVIRDIDAALDQGIGSPNLCALFSGARGSGKTALLTYISNHAHEHGWVSADVSCEAGMLEDILQRTIEASHGAARLDSTHIKTVGVPALGSVSWERASGYEPNWRTRMNDLLNQLAARGLGLVITVDEVSPRLDEMIQLVSVYQHFVREKRRVALFMAGLPHEVSMLVSDEEVSFLRRAARYHLGNVTDEEARIALRRTIEFGGRDIAQDDLGHAAHATLGYPYLMQLVGYHIWEAGSDSTTISLRDVEDGTALARVEFEQRVLEATYHSLSEGDVRFLEAMLPDEGDSRLADIAARMGVSSNYASHYRRRLEEQGVVSARRRGIVGIDLPMLKEYVRKCKV